VSNCLSSNSSVNHYRLFRSPKRKDMFHILNSSGRYRIFSVLCQSTLFKGRS
ncbi:492_t:CDS:2, partial [Acaulospora morrowiae]